MEISRVTSMQASKWLIRNWACNRVQMKSLKDFKNQTEQSLSKIISKTEQEWPKFEMTTVSNSIHFTDCNIQEWSVRVRPNLKI